MGTCLSSNKNKNHSKDAKVQESCKTPPPIQEETVKEVVALSSSEPTTTTATTNSLEDLKFSILSNKNKLKEKQKANVALTSDVSSCLTESSVSTTVCTTSRDDSDLMLHVVKKSPLLLPPRHRSSSGDFGTRREKNGGEVRMGRGKESGRVDPGERSGRRCRSPVMRVGGGYATRADLGRSLSCRRTSGTNYRVNGSGRVSKKFSESLRTKESIDNPLVSLECFIFL